MKTIPRTILSAAALVAFAMMPAMLSAEVYVSTDVTADAEVESQSDTSEEVTATETETTNSTEENMHDNSNTIDPLLGVEQNIVDVDASDKPSLQTSTSIIRKTTIQNEDQPDMIEEEETLIVSANPGQVSSRADLNTYITDLKQKNRSVKNVQVRTQEQQSTSGQATNMNEVVMKYNHPARLFGFIAVNLPSTTTLSASSDVGATYTVDTRLPWWSFLAGNKTVVKTQLESEIENDAMIQNYVSAESSARAQAQTIEKLTERISAHTQARIAAQSLTDASVNY